MLTLDNLALKTISLMGMFDYSAMSICFGIATVGDGIMHCGSCFLLFLTITAVAMSCQYCERCS